MPRNDHTTPLLSAAPATEKHNRQPYACRGGISESAGDMQ